MVYRNLNGPFKVIDRVGNNAYKIELPGEMGNVSANFNVGDLAPYISEEDLDTNITSQAEGNDAGASKTNFHEAQFEGLLATNSLRVLLIQITE